MRNMKKHDWTIMGASAWISGRPSVEKIIRENSYEGTIMVVTREDDRYGADRTPIFVLGAQGNYGKVGEKVTFIKRTGTGYGGEGKCNIQNIITIDKDKIVSSENQIGLNDKRPLWVFK